MKKRDGVQKRFEDRNVEIMEGEKLSSVAEE